ncbi:MAG: aminoacyl-histidine dipeptidase [Bacteroidales bacterium]|nr:aminoacyl-histidine dipeptidase [Bacteroidales bacterium]
MSEEIKKLQPEKLWKNFYELTQIPRPSKKEEAVASFVKAFGKKLGLETKEDATGNIVIRKPATKGYEDRETAILQGHLDMVPQKNNDVDHDFEKDPIDAYIDGEWVTAKGTTLGADNGMGVAAAMAVLEDDTLEHGPIEAFFTVDEETGMTGAFGLQEGFLKGDVLINMDSEDEGELYIGCAGGMDTIATFSYKEEPAPAGTKAYKINAKGLKGGHSGLDIHLGRGNAIKIINRLLWESARKHQLQVASFNCGDVRNAIPREGEAIAVVPEANATDFENFVKEYNQTVRSELKSVEPGLEVSTTVVDNPAKIIDGETQNNLLSAVYGVPNGVMSMVADMPEVVETSTSMGVIKTEDGKITVVTLQRSSVDSRKMDLGNMIRAIFELAGAETQHKGAYPGWNPDINSPVLETMKKVYDKEFGKVPAVKVIHAGLECGLIKAVYPNLDAISFGPTIRYPHSPDEKVNIETVKKFWDFLIYTLKEMPKK